MRPDTTPQPGSTIGNRPERSAETIPGGVGRADERIAGTATQSSGEGAAKSRAQERGMPAGHREGPAASDDRVRQAGQDG
ncbi:MAG TPA: hypothetical protein VFK38_04245 [Candidatus Limnocylindrales bacterium]|nr:hypothetical protein [Candidatus Limnocylindrales bacterium]